LRQHTTHTMAPSTTKQWTVEGKNGFDALKYNESASIPEIGDKDVLVKGKKLVLQGVSLPQIC
jgi:hypothetical protein